jgi:hypothetical protein
MALGDYNYTNGAFSDRDSLPANDPEKLIKGALFETEYQGIRDAIDVQLNLNTPVFGPSAVIQTGTFDGGLF